MITIKEPFIIIETSKTSLVFEIKDFLDTNTQFNRGRKFITQRYYGKKIDASSFEPAPVGLNVHGSCDDYTIDEKYITTSYGNGHSAEPSVLLENGDGTFINRFFYKSARLTGGERSSSLPHTRNISQVLEITEYDDVLDLYLITRYTVCDDSDVISCRKELVNQSDKELHIRRLFSLECPLDANKVKIYSYDGAWLYERNRKENILTDGVFVNQSLLGASSHKRNPFIEVYDETNDSWYAFNIMYSGNHKETVESYSLGHTSVMVGINDFAFDYLLKAKECFVTPEAVMCVCPTLDDVTSEMHDFALNHVINPKFNRKARPIIFNNWEGTEMNIDEKSLLEMVKIAKRVGVEQFVMDDGWFKNRVNDHHALGDWVVDVNKFPNGLKPFVDRVRETGLKFGIWVEPEMISIDSDIFRAHPEYACIIPNREPIERRHQLVIDMANPEVVDYVYNSLIKIFDDIKPDYIKWDFNRNLIDNYSKNVRNGEYCYRFMMGTYELINRLAARYPDMLMESCSSGGGRFDLGMLYYMPQTWGSDDTHTACRTFITCGTLAAYPQSCFGAHVSRDGSWRKGKGAASLEDRFNLNAIGSFGFEFDFRTFPESDLEIMTKQVAYYKEHRDLLQFGRYYTVDNIFDDERYFSFDTVSDDKSEAMLAIIEEESDAPAKLWKVKGLNPDYVYEVKMRPQYNLLPEQILEGKYTGKELMEKGLDVGKLSTTTDAGEHMTGIFSRMFHIRKA